MSWPIILYESRDAAVTAGHGKTPIGAMWPAPWLLGEDWKNRGTLSPSYYRDRTDRPPLMVELPCGAEFVVDGREFTGGDYYGEGWRVTGDAPKITLSPSVNIGGGWHGFIVDGSIGDDVSGKQFGSKDGLP